MEIADLVIINKYDGEYKRVCERLKRQIEGSLTLTIPKHRNDFNENNDVHDDYLWYTPVELVSAQDSINIECIWNQA